MPGLLDLFGDGADDPRSQAVMALAAGLIQGTPQGLSQGLLSAAAAPAAARERALKERYMAAQVGSVEGQEQERRAQAQKLTQALELERRKQMALPALLGMGGTGAAADARAWTAAGFSPDEITKYVNLADVGRPEVARTIDTTDAQGRPVTRQFDKFGRPVGADAAQWKAPTVQDTGGSLALFDPAARQLSPLAAKTQSPDSQASVAATIRGQDLTNARAIEANANKPLTETQSNALLFGTRMHQADKILGELAADGTTTPMPGANAGWGVGRTVTALSSSAQQRLQQAQTDFMTAILRKESGAAIGRSEFDTARLQYFPQIGDSQEVIAQKARNRALAIQGVLAGVPDSHKADLLKKIETGAIAPSGTAPGTQPGAAAQPAATGAKSFRDYGYGSEQEVIKEAQNTILKNPAARAEVERRLAALGLKLPGGR